MASKIDTLAGQLLLTQSFLAQIIVVHPAPESLINELEKTIEMSVSLTSFCTSGVIEITKSIRNEAVYWERIINEQVARKVTGKVSK